jgi:autotransporter passenger strand-loop-strand repeat protein
VSSGGYANNAAVNSGATQQVYGYTTGTTVLLGGVQNVF